MKSTAFSGLGLGAAETETAALNRRAIRKQSGSTEVRR
jgi:hypothetical protein